VAGRARQQLRRARALQRERDAWKSVTPSD